MCFPVFEYQWDAEQSFFLVVEHQVKALGGKLHNKIVLLSKRRAIQCDGFYFDVLLDVKEVYNLKHYAAIKTVGREVVEHLLAKSVVIARVAELWRQTVAEHFRRGSFAYVAFFV